MQQPERHHTAGDCSNNATSVGKNDDTDAPSDQFVIAGGDLQLSVDEDQIRGDDCGEGAGRCETQGRLDHGWKLDARPEHEQARAGDEGRRRHAKNREPNIGVDGVEPSRHDPPSGEAPRRLNSRSTKRATAIPTITPQSRPRRSGSALASTATIAAAIAPVSAGH